MWQNKLTETQVLQIKELILQGMRQVDIAKKFEISQAHVSHIKNNVKRAEVEVEEDLTAHRNFWSFSSPHLSAVISELYKGGMDQHEVSSLLNQHIESVKLLNTPGKITQPQVHSILKKLGVAPRHQGGECAPDKIEKMREMKQAGVPIRKICKTLHCSNATFYKYCGDLARKYKKKQDVKMIPTNTYITIDGVKYAGFKNDS